MRRAGGSDVHVRRMRRCGGCERYEKRITGRSAGGSKPRGGTERAGASAPLHWRQPRVPETPTEGNAGNGTRLAHSKSKEDTRGGFHECIAEHCPQLTHCSAMRRKPWSRVKPSVLRITSPKPPARLAMIHPSAQNYYLAHKTYEQRNRQRNRHVSVFCRKKLTKDGPTEGRSLPHLRGHPAVFSPKMRPLARAGLRMRFPARSSASECMVLVSCQHHT